MVKNYSLFLFFIFFVLQNEGLAVTRPLTCNQKTNIVNPGVNNETDTYTFYHPPGLIGNYTYYVLLHVHGIADRVNVLIDDLPVDTILESGIQNPVFWAGNDCQLTGTGIEEDFANCLKGPLIWSNETTTGSVGTVGTITKDFTGLVNSYFVDNKLETLYDGGKILLKIKTTPENCKVGVQVQQPNVKKGSGWEAMLLCKEDLPCPSLEVEKSFTCENDLKLSVLPYVNACLNVNKNIKLDNISWIINSAPPITKSGPEINFSNTSDLSVISYNLTTTFSSTKKCVVTQGEVINFPELLDAWISTKKTSCVETKDGETEVIVQKGVGPFSYLWNTGSTEMKLTGLAPGFYTVTVTDSRNPSCSIIKQAEVIAADSYSLIVQPTDVKCYEGSDGSAEVVGMTGNKGTGPYDYQWSNQSTGASLTGVPAGNYTLTVKNAQGCLSSTTINIDHPDPLNFDFSVIGTACEGPSSLGEIKIKDPTGGIMPYQFGIDGTIPSLNQTNFDASIGSHTVQMVDANGCKLQKDANVPYDEAKAYVRVLNDGCNINASIELINSSGITIDSKKILDIDQSAINVENLTAFVDYKFKGCDYSGDYSIENGLPERFVKYYIPNVFSPNDDNSNNLFFISFSRKAYVRGFYIYSRWGELIYQYIPKDNFIEPGDTAHGWDGTFRGKPLDPGVYVYRLVLDCKTVSGSVTIVK